MWPLGSLKCYVTQEGWGCQIFRKITIQKVYGSTLLALRGGWVGGDRLQEKKHYVTIDWPLWLAKKPITWDGAKMRQASVWKLLSMKSSAPWRNWSVSRISGQRVWQTDMNKLTKDKAVWHNLQYIRAVNLEPFTSVQSWATILEICGTSLQF